MWTSERGLEISKRIKPADAQIVELKWLNLEVVALAIPKSTQSAREVAGLSVHLSCTKRK